MNIFRKIYRSYCYLFYLDYLWQSKPGIRMGNPAISATGSLVFLFIPNFMSVVIFLQMFFFGETFMQNVVYKGAPHFLIIIVFPVWFIHDFIFLRKKRYLKIVQYYEEHPINKKIGSIIHWTHVVGSLTVFAALVFFGILLGKHNLIPLIDHFPAFIRLLTFN